MPAQQKKKRHACVCHTEQPAKLKRHRHCNPTAKKTLPQESQNRFFSVQENGIELRPRLAPLVWVPRMMSPSCFPIHKCSKSNVRVLLRSGKSAGAEGSATAIPCFLGCCSKLDGRSSCVLECSFPLLLLTRSTPLPPSSWFFYQQESRWHVHFKRLLRLR